MRLCLILLVAVSAARAADSCAWLNAATAGGFLDGPVTMTVERGKRADDATCTFVRKDGTRTLELRIEVETMQSPAKDFGAFASRCHTAAVALKAIGNEAMACSDSSAAGPAEQIVGRVRDRAFVVRFASTDRAADSAMLREKARKISEQVAGILF